LRLRSRAALYRTSPRAPPAVGSHRRSPVPHGDRDANSRSDRAFIAPGPATGASR
jgi:hypothetical protein